MLFQGAGKEHLKTAELAGDSVEPREGSPACQMGNGLPCWVPAQEAEGPGSAGLIHLHVVKLALGLCFQTEVVEL